MRYVLSCVVVGILAGVAPAPAANDAAAKALVNVPGRIEPAGQAQLYSRIMGFVRTVNVDIGDRVNTGQVLAELAVPEVEAELKQKEALVAQADAEVQRAEQNQKEARANREVVRAQIDEAQAAVQSAKATVDLRKSRFERVKLLAASKAVDEQTVQETAHDLKAAQAAMTEAESRVRTAKAVYDAGEAKLESAKTNIKVVAAQREAARAEVQRVKALLGYARVTAPFDGVVTHRAAVVGMLAGHTDGKGDPLFTVTRIDTVRAVVAVAEKDSARVLSGAEAIVKVAGRAIKAKITRTAGAIDPQKGTLRVEIDLPNPDGKLLPGMFCEVGLALAPEK